MRSSDFPATVSPRLPRAVVVVVLGKPTTGALNQTAGKPKRKSKERK